MEGRLTAESRSLGERVDQLRTEIQAVDVRLATTHTAARKLAVIAIGLIIASVAVGVVGWFL